MYIRGKKISQTSAMHYTKLVFRAFLFVIGVITYIYSRLHDFDGLDALNEYAPWFLWAIATIFTIEMSYRFLPSSIESKGCQKQFEENYRPINEGQIPKIDSKASTLVVAMSWIALNAAIFAAYFLGFIDQGILVLICLAYSVCDMICILFFCPFQTWMMKNKCCGTCRIYNWDYIMMFTPCLLIDHYLAKILFILAAILCLEWEVIYHKHPERFAENTNAFLQCANCTEKLCSHKRQLQRYLVIFRQRLAEAESKVGTEVGMINSSIKDQKEKLKEKIEEKL